MVTLIPCQKSSCIFNDLLSFFKVEHEVLLNCHLTLVGDSFARQPYALAVQQGSSLREELGLILLELQKDGALETLRGSYWSASAKADCPVLDGSKGLTLDSLGGVFIVSGAGHIMAAIILLLSLCFCRGAKDEEELSGKKEKADTFKAKKEKKKITKVKPV